MEPKITIIQNAILINGTGEILRSNGRHDYKERNIYKFILLDKVNNRFQLISHLLNKCFYNEKDWFMVDGGLDYIRQSYYVEPNYVTDLNLYSNSTIEEFVDKLTWGTYGKDGKQKFKYVLLKNCETDHLENILKIGTFDGIYTKTINAILKERNEKEKIN